LQFEKDGVKNGVFGVKEGYVGEACEVWIVLCE